MKKAIVVVDMPENCRECIFYKSTGRFDEYAGFGDCMIYRCPFGCSHDGCYIKRPDDCPLIQIDQDEINLMDTIEYIVPVEDWKKLGYTDEEAEDLSNASKIYT